MAKLTNGVSRDIVYKGNKGKRRIMGIKLLTLFIKPDTLLEKSSRIALGRLKDIIREDIDIFSNGKYSYDEIIYQFQSDKKKGRRYLQEIEEDIYEDIEGYLQYDSGNKTIYINRIKGLLYDFDRLADIESGHHFVLSADDLTALYTKSNFSDFKSTVFPEGYAMTVSLQEHEYTNILLELGNTGICIDGEPVKRLSMSAITEGEIVVIGEYEFLPSDPDTMYVTHKNGSPYCRSKCGTKNPAYKNYQSEGGLFPARTGNEIYCEIKKDEYRGCIPYKVNPFLLLNILKYVYVIESEENIRKLPIENTDNSFAVAKVYPGEELEEYRIKALTPNYTYEGASAEETKIQQP